MKLNETAQNIIKRIEYVTLATVDENGLPWNAPVYYAYDKDYTFYWGSHIASQHAKNVRKNSHVFLTIYNSTAAPGKGEGVYIQAICSELIDPEEISTAHALIQTRRAPIAYWKRDQFQSESPIRLYKAIPTRIWINGEDRSNGTYIDIRVTAEES